MDSLSSVTTNNFLSNYLPNGPPCRNAYWISLGIFAIIHVVPLSLLELKEQAIVQVTLGIMRFVTMEEYSVLFSNFFDEQMPNDM